MSKIVIALTLLFAVTGTAFGATGDVMFFGTLGLLIALNILFAGLLVLGAVVVAGYLRDRARQARLQPVRVHDRPRRATRRRGDAWR